MIEQMQESIEHLDFSIQCWNCESDAEWVATVDCCNMIYPSCNVCKDLSVRALDTFSNIACDCGTIINSSNVSWISL